MDRNHDHAMIETEECTLCQHDKQMNFTRRETERRKSGRKGEHKDD